LLALAENATVLDHQHFDGEGTEGFLHPETGWELLVERTDKRRPGGAGAG
jgi:hypothetical protein